MQFNVENYKVLSLGRANKSSKCELVRVNINKTIYDHDLGVMVAKQDSIMRVDINNTICGHDLGVMISQYIKPNRTLLMCVTKQIKYLSLCPEMLDLREASLSFI